MALPMPPFFKRKTDRIPQVGEPSSLPTLSSQRLNLCWIDHADVSSIFQIYSDSKVIRYRSNTPLMHQDDAHIYIESIHHGFNDGKLFQWGICLQGSQKLIGTCTLSDISPAQGRAEVGFAIASEHWGHGYGREAMGTLVKYAFTVLGLRRLEADVDPHNAKCLKSLEALGFKREGYLRQRWLVAGELQDSVILGLLKSDCMLESSVSDIRQASASVSPE
ncbi:MAG: GNAT family N-acetyltransferase [Arenimonas sp.]